MSCAGSQLLIRDGGDDAWVSEAPQQASHPPPAVTLTTIRQILRVGRRNKTTRQTNRQTPNLLTSCKPQPSPVQSSPAAGGVGQQSLRPMAGGSVLLQTKSGNWETTTTRRRHAYAQLCREMEFTSILPQISSFGRAPRQEHNVWAKAWPDQLGSTRNPCPSVDLSPTISSFFRCSCFFFFVFCDWRTHSQAAADKQATSQCPWQWELALQNSHILHVSELGQHSLLNLLD